MKSGILLPIHHGMSERVPATVQLRWRQRQRCGVPGYSGERHYLVDAGGATVRVEPIQEVVRVSGDQRVLLLGEFVGVPEGGGYQQVDHVVRRTSWTARCWVAPSVLVHGRRSLTEFLARHQSLVAGSFSTCERGICRWLFQYM